MKNINTCVIIPAAGSGKRFGAGMPKQYLELQGIPLIIRTIRLFYDMPETESIVIPIHKDWEQFLTKALQAHHLSGKVSLAPGGAERQDSVYNAINSGLSADADIILIHDAVRPFASRGLVKEIIDFALLHGSAIPALTPKETIKEVTAAGFVASTLDRSSLVSVQTPQGFRKEIILEAFRKAIKDGITATDDASLAAYAGFDVKVVQGEETNIKITTPLDFKLAELIIGEKIKS